MRYSFEHLAKKQIILDSFIRRKSDVISDNEYWKKRIIALNVELSEVMNEIKFFKFWSKKKPSEKSIILEEWVDCLHFSLSLANTLKISNFNFISKKININIGDLYIELEKEIINSYNNASEESLIKIIQHLCDFAFFLNFTMSDIEIAYKKKNEINFNRQNTNY